MPLANPFNLLADSDYEDPYFLLAAQRQKLEKSMPLSAAAEISSYRSKKAPLTPSKSSANPPARFPFKPLPPSQAAKGRGLSDRNSNFDPENIVVENGLHRSFSALADGEIEIKKHIDGERRYGCGTHNWYHGRRGAYSNEEVEIGDRPLRRQFDRHSALGRGNVIKREGSGPWNWGVLSDQGQTTKLEGFNFACNYTVIEERANGVGTEKEDNTYNEIEEQGSEDEEMALSEYEKVLEEKKKALRAVQKTEQRKVDVDKEFASMLQLSAQNSADEIFIILDQKRKQPRRKIWITRKRWLRNKCETVALLHTL